MALPIIGAIAAAAGIGMSLFGASESKKQAKKTAKIAAQSAKKQNKIIKKEIKPLLKAQGEAQEKASAESRAAEELRKKQMTLDAARTRRDIIRNMTTMRSLSLARGVAQGAQDSSSIIGSLSQIMSEGARQTRGVNQNEEIGLGIFGHNLRMSEFLSEANRYGTEINLAQTKMQTVQNKFNARLGVSSANDPGAFYSTLGGSILQNAGTIDSLGTSVLFGNNNSWVGPLGWETTVTRA